MPQLEATPRTAQQCQPGTPVTGQSATGEGTTVDTAKNGPTVMAMADGRKQQSNHLQAHVPSWSSRGALSHGVKTTRPCFVPRTARARTTAAPRTTRPVALTPQQGRRHLWQAKQATLHLRHDDRAKKGTPRRLISYPFFSSSFSLLLQGPEKGIPRKGSFSAKEPGSAPPITDQWFEGWPPEGSTAASDRVGPTPTTGQGFEGQPPEGFHGRLRLLGLRAHY